MAARIIVTAWVSGKSGLTLAMKSGNICTG